MKAQELSAYFFQEFDDPRDAEDAVYELDGKELCNERYKWIQCLFE